METLFQVGDIVEHPVFKARYTITGVDMKHGQYKTKEGVLIGIYCNFFVKVQ